MHWNDFLYVLAVVETGSALRAAERLGVNQATVLRRLDAIEAATGAQFFERTRSGLKPTEMGRLAAETAERIEQETQVFEKALAARRRSLAGSVRLTTSIGLADRLVLPGMRTFQSLYPSITVELLVADERLDIARGDADVALRAGSTPEGAGVVARRLPDVDWTIYCSRAYAAERGAPADRARIRGHEIVGLDGHVARLPAWQWLKESVPDAAVRFRSNSLVNMVSNLKAGLGVGPLPTLTGDAEPELMRCFPPPPELRSELWLIVREAIKTQPQVRALAEFLASYIRDTMSEAALPSSP
ncbi:MAG: LysR family transcriptional regulator [Rhodospirillaceae bacterium]|nr:LysR family transcriptional regulator [Rhodospirillaceae bacterium]